MQAEPGAVVVNPNPEAATQPGTQFACVVHPAPAATKECPKNDASDVLGSLLGMSWAFATLAIGI